MLLRSMRQVDFACAIGVHHKNVPVIVHVTFVGELKGEPLQGFLEASRLAFGRDGKAKQKKCCGENRSGDYAFGGLEKRVNYVWRHADKGKLDSFIFKVFQRGAWSAYSLQIGCRFI